MRNFFFFFFFFFLNGFSQVFDDAAALERHVTKKHQSITFRCNYPGCAAFYPARAQLARHVSSKHVSFTHDCIFAGCSKSYQKPSQLHAHLQQKHNVTAYQCAFSDCNKLFLTHVGLRNHVASKHPAITFHCVSCQHSFATALELHAHSLRLHAAPDADVAEAVVRAMAARDVVHPPPADLPDQPDALAMPPPPPQQPLSLLRDATPFSDLGIDEGTSSANESSAATASHSRGTKRGRSPAAAARRGRSPSADGLPSLATPHPASFGVPPVGLDAPPHVKGPRALYSSPVPQQPLTRSSRQ